MTGDQPSRLPIFTKEFQENLPVPLYLGGQIRVIPKVEAGFRSDAYIRYVDPVPNTTWVGDTLLPKLQKEGLKVVVSGDVEEFGVARVRVANIERGIREAKRTVIVISEVYLGDNIAKFENALGQTIGIQEGTYRLLPVKSMALGGNRLPTRLSMLTTLGLSHPRRAERVLQRLVRSLKTPFSQDGIIGLAGERHV